MLNVSKHFQASKVESFDAEAAASPPETTPEKPKAQPVVLRLWP